jgi:enhancing lycopene biosynthesis protein 2
MLVESARIARGHIKPLTTVAPQDYAAVILPGGNGTAKNLCNFATAGNHMEVDISVADFLKGAHKAGKPIGAVCISPVIVGRLFGDTGLQLTLGTIDNDAAKAARSWGCTVIAAGPGDIVIDKKQRIVTTPAYMCDATVAEVAGGIRQLSRAVVEMA